MVDVNQLVIEKTISMDERKDEIRIKSNERYDDEENVRIPSSNRSLNSII